MFTDEEIKSFINGVKNNDSAKTTKRSEVLDGAAKGGIKIQPVEFHDFGIDVSKPAVKASLDYFKDIYIDVRIELGQAKLKVKEVLELETDSVIELNKSAGDSVDVFINEVLCANAEVIVINNKFSVRISKIVYPQANAILEGKSQTTDRQNQHIKLDILSEKE